MMMMMMMTRKHLNKVLVLLFGLLAIFAVVKDEISSPLLFRTLRGKTKYYSTDIFMPPSLDVDSQRLLSLDLGGGSCKWQSPIYNVPEELDLHKTLIAGFPSGDKRMIYVQMEALTGWPAKDEWDFEFSGMSNHPFIKANYPHHEGIWGWGNAADQVVLMIRSVRRSMVEYHDILWDIGYAADWESASLLLDDLYAERPPQEDFLVWRDLRALEEAHWYGWFIDYWMEGGLMRDMFTHKITTPEHWNMIMMPGVYTIAELDYDLVVGPNTIVTPSYDPHCAYDEVTSGCTPVAVISAEKLRDYTEGPAETAKIAKVLLKDERTGQYVIAEETWNCIWEELIPRGQGLKTVYDRPGFVESDYNFSVEMLEEMITELDRLITKYSGSDWNTKDTANRIVELLGEHRDLIQTELDEVNSGVRQLTGKDFLGPKERRRRLQVKVKNQTEPVAVKKQKDYSEYFNSLEHKVQAQKRRDMIRLARKAKAEADAMT